ncbi:MAG: FliM/FliN family flagellar motor switch protein [Roseinatronobacter sp.]
MTQSLRPDSGVFAAANNPLGQMAARHQVAAQLQKQEQERGLRVAFGRMARELPEIEAQVVGVSVMRISLAEVSDMLEPAMFVALLEGQGDRIGASLICPALMAGLVEGAATGRVLSAPPTSPRQPTRTDAALVAPLVDTLLHQIRDRSAASLDDPMQSGWVYGSYLADPRPLPLILEEGAFRLIRFDVSLGQGRVSGMWSLLLPEQATEIARPTPALAAPSWAEQVEAAVHACPVDFSVILYRAQLALETAMTLNVGDTLCIPMSALEAMTLETLDGHALATGRLGQARGQRAIRLGTDLGQIADPAMLAIPKARSLTPVISAAQSETDNAPPSLTDSRR